jgi:hypothetical protein
MEILRFHRKRAMFLLDRNGWNREQTSKKFVDHCEAGVYDAFTHADIAAIAFAIRDIPLADRTK